MAQRKSKFNLMAAYPVILAGTAVAFFFTQGLPLWNDDYSQWIQQAQGGFFQLLARILLPFTAEPETWGYSDRPIEVLVFKLLHGIFGYWGTGYYFIKALGFGGLCWGMQRWMRKLGVSRTISWLALGTFALSANVTASLIWHSDFGVYSQLILVLILFESAARIRSLSPSAPSFKRIFAVYFGAVYFGAKLKGDVRLAPLILLAYLYAYDRKKVRELGPWLGATFLATLPWSVMMFKHLPPFIVGQGYQGWTYGRFSLGQVLSFLAGDFLTLRGVPISLLGGVGLLALAGALAPFLLRLSQSRLKAPGRETGLLWVWLGFSVLSLGMVSQQNPTFELRYTLLSLVPATLLLAHALETARRDFAAIRGFEHGLLAVLALQCVFQFRHSAQHRIDMGHTIAGIDGVFSEVETRHANAQFVLGPGFLNYGYRDSQAPALRNRVAVGDVSELGRFPAQSTYMASWASTLDPKFSVAAFASGCTASLFDVIFRCGPTDGAFLLKYVGEIPEVAQAADLDRRGNLRGARQVLESYWNREPGNHGVAFILGLYDYRLNDFAAMERVYDGFAPAFPSQASVVYNWALAKMGADKLADASRLFERAYNLAPGDYGIGFNLADTYYRLGKRSRALATVGELLRAYPQNEALTRAKQHYMSDPTK